MDNNVYNVHWIPFFFKNSLQNNNMISQYFFVFFDKKIGNLLEIFCSINSIDRIIPHDEHRMLYNLRF
jgi:hypothetical protein